MYLLRKCISRIVACFVCKRVLNAYVFVCIFLDIGKTCSHRLSKKCLSLSCCGNMINSIGFI